jgi:hypothetical protein
MNMSESFTVAIDNPSFVNNAVVSLANDDGMIPAFDLRMECAGSCMPVTQDKTWPAWQSTRVSKNRD